MSKKFSFNRLVSIVSLVLMLLILSSSYTAVSATEIKQTGDDFNVIVITDEKGNILDLNDLVITESIPTKGVITPRANIVSKQVTVTKQSIAGYFTSKSISYSAPSGLLTPWSGTLNRTRTYSIGASIPVYYTVYSGTVYAQSR